MTSYAPNPTEDGAFTALTAFLDEIVPQNCDVIQGQPNRVPEPKNPNFVVMTPRSRQRLSTNKTDYADVQFIASISGTTMTVTEIAFGAILPGATVFGAGVTDGTQVVSGPSDGGVGAYVVDNAQTVASREMAAGVQTIEQATEFVVQLDVHGPLAGDIAQTISTLLRSSWGVDQFAAQDPNYGLTPLYSEDPRQLPFGNDQQQIENRYMIEAHFQVNPVVTVPQQFATEAVVGLVSIDERYPVS